MNNKYLLSSLDLQQPYKPYQNPSSGTKNIGKVSVFFFFSPLTISSNFKLILKHYLVIVFLKNFKFFV